MYGVAVSTQSIIDGLSVHYYSFLSKEEKAINQSVTVEILQRRDVPEEARDRIRYSAAEIIKEKHDKGGY